LAILNNYDMTIGGYSIGGYWYYFIGVIGGY
jgi:hypothetical protein